MLLALGLLVILDLGRSVYARLGYARPMEIWQPAPAVYADLTWPLGADLPPMRHSASICIRSAAPCATGLTGVATALRHRR